jgi:hypothetical protein
MELEPRQKAEELVRANFRKIEEAVLEFVNHLRDKLDNALEELSKARSLAEDALNDLKEDIAPALGQGPRDELDRAASEVDSILGDAESALEEARDSCYTDDFDFGDVQEGDE